MAVTLNTAGETHARALIGAGNYDNTAAWSFSAEDGDTLLGSDGDNWTAFSSFHLGEDTAATQDTKARWKYPFGKGGKVYGAALRAIRSRASQQGDTAVFEAAGQLLDQINAKEGEASGDGDATDRSQNRNRILPFNRSRTPAKASGYRMIKNADAEDAEIYLYGLIGGGGWFGDSCVTANQFRQDLVALGDVKAIDLRINSEGGDVFDGQAIYNLLVQHKAAVTAYVDGLAASAASFICMAANKICMAENSFMMIHNASGFTFGTASDHTKTAQLLSAVDGTLADVYAARTRTDLATVKQMMDDETWMSGKEAVDKKFADELMPNLQVAACVSDPARYRKLPSALRPNRVAAMAAIASMSAA